MRYRLFMHYAEGSLMTMLLLALFVDRKCSAIPMADWRSLTKVFQKFEMRLEHHSSSSRSLAPLPAALMPNF